MKRPVQISNPSDGGLLFWLLKLYGFTAFALLAILLYALGGLYIFFAAQPLPDLANFSDTAPSTTRFYGQDGALLAEFATQHRSLVPLERIPRTLVDAFIATEDRRFFRHGGIDYRGTLRALVTNLRAGQVAQGGSTITQQVAKSFLSSERSFSRKIREAILARRLEARFSKEEILATYLNQIYLGNGAYGVGAAAQRYFNKEVWELDLGEQAMIAGLARAPSRDSPLVSERTARDRRAQVFANLVAVGALKDQEAARWNRTPLRVQPRRDYLAEVAPYYSEHVRRALVEKLGAEAFYRGGYRVETAALPYLDALAADNVDAAVRRLDKRQGWRGPEAHVDGALAELFRRRARELYGDGPLLEGKLYLGLVEQVGGDARVRVGDTIYPLPLVNMQWAARYSARDATNDKLIASAHEALHKGDVIWVRWNFQSRIPRFSEFSYDELGEVAWIPEQADRPPPPGPQILALEQQPRVQGSIYSFDHRNGYVLAMVGGDDFDASEFNRVVQSCRQPGSAYKPIYYSLALDRGYSFDTLWNDKPKPEMDPVTGEMWIPENIDGSYGVQVTLERALVWSKNPPSGEIFATLGTQAAADWHQRFGFSTPLVPDEVCLKKYCPSLALGASCVHTDDLARAFAIFARAGRPIETVYLRRLIDRNGRVLEDHTAWDDPWLDGASRLDRIQARFGDDPDPVLAPRTAWLTSHLLRKIVTQGHSAPIRAIKIPAAGKTGTSSRTSDVWFIGYTSRWLTSAWIGDDTYERQLGYKDASFMLSVPMWARYMAAASSELPIEEIPWERPPGVKPHDTGGPLKLGFPPPPALGMTPDGKPYAPPILKEGVAIKPAANLPLSVKPPRIIRVPGAAPHPTKEP